MEATVFHHFHFSNTDQYRVKIRNRFIILAKPEAADPTNLFK